MYHVLSDNARADELYLATLFAEKYQTIWTEMDLDANDLPESLAFAVHDGDLWVFAVIGEDVVGGHGAVIAKRVRWASKNEAESVFEKVSELY